MATRNPRVAVAVTDEAYATLGQLADMQGVSRSRVVRELIEEWLPVGRHLVELAGQLRDAGDERRAEIAAMVNGPAGQQLERSLADTSGQYERLLRAAVGEAKK